MPTYTCPSCRQAFANSDEPDAPCIYCGHRLSQFVAARGFHPGSQNYSGIAQGQRWMIQSSVFALAGQAYFIFGPWVIYKGWPLSFVAIAPTFWLMVAIIRLITALEGKPDKAFVGGLVMFVPVVNIIVMVGLNTRAAEELRKAGMHVGLFGVKHGQVLTALDPTKCRTCGYDLTGNTSGRCPECGTAIPR